MKFAEGVRRHGFRKWYERQLLTSHACLVLVLICMVGILVAMEAATRFRSWSDQLADLASLLLCAAVGLWALRRYLSLLLHAESVARQADCTRCKTYGRLDLMKADASGDSAEVRCRKCGQVWRIEA